MKPITKIYFVVFLLRLPYWSYSQETMNLFHKNGKLKGQLTLFNNQLNGDFLSYYESGNLKAKGSFLNNQRMGVWEVFDTSGQKKIVRNYTNNRLFKTIEKSNKTNYAINNLPYADLTNNDSVYILAEKDVVFSRELILDVQDISKYLVKELLNCAKKKAYSSEELRETVDTSFNWSNQLSNLDKIKIKLKVHWIYDQKLEMSFTKIFGIGLYDCSMNDDKPICWLWYTDVRNWLNKLNNIDLIKEINELHELRFDIKFSKIKSISSTEEIIPQDVKFQKELLFDLFDIEHVFWFDIEGHFSFGNRRFKRLYVLH